MVQEAHSNFIGYSYSVLSFQVKKMASSSLASHGRENPYVSQFQVRNFSDPSEPIYTDPSLFERPNMLRDVTARTLGKLNGNISTD